MENNLLTQALAKFSLGVIILGILIFLPACSLHYWQGWLLMGILFVPMFVAGLVMLAKNPDLLRKRLNAKEQEAEQKTVEIERAPFYHRIRCRRIKLALRLVGIA